MPFVDPSLYSSSLVASLHCLQIGKAFRNEISPRDLLFRLREFEQMEIEYFCDPSTAAVGLKALLPHS